MLRTTGIKLYFVSVVVLILIPLILYNARPLDAVCPSLVLNVTDKHVLGSIASPLNLYLRICPTAIYSTAFIDDISVPFSHVIIILHRFLSSL
jgi:hypothetical protein